MSQARTILPSSMVRPILALNGSLSTQLMRSCMGTWGATGNTPFLQNAEVGEFENRYLTTYGSIVRWKGAIGVREFLKIEFPPLPDRGLDR